jgi:hypothetical protein
MSNNPLGDYLNDLLTPSQPAAADWDSMLAEAVEPFQETTGQVDSTVALVTLAEPEMAETTIVAGREPVLAVKPECLNAHERYAELLNNLQLARVLPQSRLRDCVLASCNKTLLARQYKDSELPVVTAGNRVKVAVYD